jgi:hypothetical protein
MTVGELRELLIDRDDDLMVRFVAGDVMATEVPDQRILLIAWDWSAD